jgi:hypothetical protein
MRKLIHKAAKSASIRSPFYFYRVEFFRPDTGEILWTMDVRLTTESTPSQLKSLLDAAFQLVTIIELRKKFQRDNFNG